MKKMLFGLMTAIATFTGCESKQPAGELPRIDLTATSFAFDQVEIADEIESIEYVPLELTDESLIADVLDLCVSDEYIFVYSTRQDGVLQFDRKGKYLRCIANRKRAGRNRTDHFANRRRREPPLLCQRILLHLFLLL